MNCIFLYVRSMYLLQEAYSIINWTKTKCLTIQTIARMLQFNLSANLSTEHENNTALSLIVYNTGVNSVVPYFHTQCSKIFWRIPAYTIHNTVDSRYTLSLKLNGDWKFFFTNCHLLWSNGIFCSPGYGEQKISFDRWATPLIFACVKDTKM